MRCELVTYPGGRAVMVCGSRRKRTYRVCSYCGKTADRLCDFPTGKRTCDVPMCASCSVKRGGGDLCPAHARAWKGEPERSQP